MNKAIVLYLFAVFILVFAGVDASYTPGAVSNNTVDKNLTNYSNTPGFRVNASGNVSLVHLNSCIQLTNSAGTNYKLWVNGSALNLTAGTCV